MSVSREENKMIVTVDDRTEVVELIQNRMFNCIMCMKKNMTSAEASKFAEAAFPAGTHAGWRAATDRSDMKVPCAEHEDREHWLFNA